MGNVDDDAGPLTEGVEEPLVDLVDPAPQVGEAFFAGGIISPGGVILPHIHDIGL